jgi:hypothetical protein
MADWFLMEQNFAENASPQERKIGDNPLALMI